MNDQSGQDNQVKIIDETNWKWQASDDEETTVTLHQHEVVNGAKRRGDVSITKDI